MLRKETSKRKQEEREVIYGGSKTETKLTLIFLTPVVNKTKEVSKNFSEYVSHYSKHLLLLAITLHYDGKK